MGLKLANVTAHKQMFLREAGPKERRESGEDKREFEGLLKQGS